MFCRGLLIVATLSLVIVNSPSARADLCFRYTTTGGGTLVLKGITLPAANTCQPIAMYEAVDAPAPGLGGAATGSICHDGTDGRTIIFQYTYDGCTGNYFESGICRLQLPNDGSLPTVSSTCRLTLGSGIFYLEIDDGVLSSCDSSALPVPGGGGGQCLGATPHRAGPATPLSGAGTKAR
jgi:hypothetical protein